MNTQSVLLVLGIAIIALAVVYLIDKNNSHSVKPLPIKGNTSPTQPATPQPPASRYHF